MRELCNRLLAVRVVGGLLTVALAVALPLPSSAQYRTEFTSMIAERSPCASVRAAQFGVSVGVDTLFRLTHHQSLAEDS